MITDKRYVLRVTVQLIDADTDEIRGVETNELTGTVYALLSMATETVPSMTKVMAREVVDKEDTEQLSIELGGNE